MNRVPASLNPKQREILERLVDYGGGRPVFPHDLASRLRTRLEDGLWPLLSARRTATGDESRGESTWFLSKGALSTVHRCEGLHLARRRVPLQMNRNIARGILAHKAIERLLLDPSVAGRPLDAARAALTRVATDQSSLLAWVAGLSQDERAELLGEVANLVTDFAIQWPPIPAAWTPRVESRAATVLCRAGRSQGGTRQPGGVKLAGRYDLALGVPRGTEARSLIIDLKAGDVHADHMSELRFYALLETLRCGVPPYRVAAYSLERADYLVEPVGEDLLHRTVDWIVDGAAALVAVEGGTRQPTTSPSGLCAWCPALPACEAGAVWLAGRDGRREQQSFAAHR